MSGNDFAIDQKKLTERGIQSIIAQNVFPFVKFTCGDCVSWTSAFAQLTMTFMDVGGKPEEDEARNEERYKVMERFWNDNWRFACKKLNEKRSNVNSKVKGVFISK